MPQPLGYPHRFEDTVRGRLARWWFDRRCRAVRRALDAKRELARAT